jgi:hypothetical protein
MKVNGWDLQQNRHVPDSDLPLMALIHTHKCISVGDVVCVALRTFRKALITI